jgi:hypothetical protein
MARSKRRRMGPRKRVRAPARAAACLSLALFGCADNPVELFPSSPQAPADATTASTTHDAASAAASEGGGAPACHSDNDCPSPDTPRCDLARQTCVECVGDSADCDGRASSVCNRLTEQCAFPCTTNRDCPSDDVCDSRQGVCVECLTDRDCADPGEPLCLQEQEKCVECKTDRDCTGGTQCWLTACVACVTSADCPDGEGCSNRHECR